MYVHYVLFYDVSGFVTLIFIVCTHTDTGVWFVVCGRFAFELDASHIVEMMPTVTTRAKYGIKLIFTARN